MAVSPFLQNGRYAVVHIPTPAERGGVILCLSSQNTGNGRWLNYYDFENMLGVVVTHVAATLFMRDMWITDALTVIDTPSGSSHLPYV